MFDAKALSGQIPASLAHSASSLVASGAIEQAVYNAKEYPAVLVKGRVSLRLSGVSYYPSVRIDDDRSRILSFSCTCALGRGGASMCVHEAALLQFYLNARSAGRIRFDSDDAANRSSPLIRRFLELTNEEPASVRSPAAVYLQPTVVFSDTDDTNHTLTVEFRIGKRGLRSYVLKSIEELIQHDRSHTQLQFGKSLSFIPCEEAFEPDSRPLYRFLRSLSGNIDRFKAGDPYSFYSRYAIAERYAPGRYLTLKGRYLDAFIEAVKPLGLYYDMREGRSPKTVCMHISDDPLAMNSVLIKQDDGSFVFQTDAPSYFLGEKYIYFIDPLNERIAFAPADSGTELCDLLDLCHDARCEKMIVSSSDIRPFVRRIAPMAGSILKLETDGLSLADYLPEKPVFRFYLDLPQKNLVTCETKAVYQSGSFNIYDPKRKSDLRNISEETAVESAIAQYFNTYDPSAMKMGIADDNDRTALFLDEGIPFLQTLGEVFISESLKKLQVRTPGKFSIGVSLTSNLLELSVDSDPRSLSDLAEILSRYRPKKKYYRLKNGDFVTIRDESALAELARFSEDLQLSARDIAKGSASLPAYRALYIEKSAEEYSSFPISRDEYFRDLISRIDDTSAPAEIPASLHAELRDYQKEGYQWLKKLRDNHFAALLADEMGLGKTVQVIALLCSIENRGQTLVVCPASLVYNWHSEIRRFAPDIPAVMIAGSAKARTAQIQSAPKDAVLITSYDTLKRDASLYSSMHFDVQIIDEAQYIKNAATQAADSVKSIDAGFRIALTGTPIENRLSEIWSIFDYLMPGFLYRYSRFRTQFEQPIVRDMDADASARLRRMISPFILRRRKIDVLKDLPEKLEEIYYAPFENEQKELYEARAQRLKLMLMKTDDKAFRTQKIEILSELMRLRQICCAPALLYEDYHGNSEKEDLCIQLIRNAVEGGHKILLFSQFKSMLERLNEQLEKEHIKYYFLSGDTPKEKRARMVEAFQQDEVPVFSISLKAGGTGLNLTAADIVIHYDPWWNVAAENQASDRTHRIGQTNPVTVYKLIVEGTIEQKILDLQERKSDLADEILSGEEMSASQLSREQLMEIL